MVQGRQLCLSLKPPSVIWHMLGVRTKVVELKSHFGELVGTFYINHKGKKGKQLKLFVRNLLTMSGETNRRTLSHVALFGK